MTFGGYQSLWVFVMFDLPTLTKEDKRVYRQFHDDLLELGFFMIQYSLYTRSCATDDRASTVRDNLVAKMPRRGEIRLMMFTDKQWARQEIFGAPVKKDPEEPPEQLSFF